MYKSTKLALVGNTKRCCRICFSQICNIVAVITRFNVWRGGKDFLKVINDKSNNNISNNTKFNSSFMWITCFTYFNKLG